MLEGGVSKPYVCDQQINDLAFSSNACGFLLAVAGIVKPYIMSKDMRKGEAPQSIADLLPDWVGYGTLYGISIVPVVIVVAVVSLLFVTSLK